MNLNPISGLYRHYKGGTYLFIGLAQHTEPRTSNWRSNVALNPELPGLRLRARPAEEFFGTVTIDGESVPRFVHVSHKPEEPR